MSNIPEATPCKLNEQIPVGPMHDEIAEECEIICDLLQRKNAAYGNSALEPLRIFSNINTTEQLRVRIDDKLSRLSRGNSSYSDEDVVLDLIGYLILLRISVKNNCP